MHDSWTIRLNSTVFAGGHDTPVSVSCYAAETLFGLLLLVLGWKTRLSALLSGVLLGAFTLTMTMALGVKAPLNFSVFSAAGGALLLATCADVPFSLDKLLLGNRQGNDLFPRDRAGGHDHQ
jgi:uncharacterized membrane protein YphA (DoxX/SURF4 family)